MNILKDKIALVSGARGICALKAGELLLEQGATVILLDAPGDELNSRYDALADTFGLDENSNRLAIYPLDPATAGADECTRMRVDIGNAYPGIDIVVHNHCALCPPQAIDEVGVADWHRLFQINLHFPWLVQTALRALQSKRTHPRVVFIADELNEPWLGAYALSKTAQMHLMRAYARESRPERHPTDPIVTAVTVSTLDTEARRYYFPGQLPSAASDPERLKAAVLRALSVDAVHVHGNILSCEPTSADS
ncbi:MAG: SDR family oxidoreductase [Proteobacteria bacterium]|nr:SDR family oxidoreductase [Pseudomonadota bacterium]